jgi:hypothetical protein
MFKIDKNKTFGMILNWMFLVTENQTLFAFVKEIDWIWIIEERN